MDDDNDVRKVLFTLLESAGHCIDADRFRAALAAKARIDEVACQVIEKRMPGMIGRDLIAALKVRNLTIQTLLIMGAHEPDIARRADDEVPGRLSGDDPAKQWRTSLPPLVAGQPNLSVPRFHGMLLTQTAAADICRRDRT